MRIEDVPLPGLEPTEAPVRMWAVEYVTPRRKRFEWAVISNVPATLAKAEVLEALGTWPMWPGWSKRVEPGGSITVRRLNRSDLERDEVTAYVLDWEKLAPASRRVSFDVVPGVHAAAVRAAAAEGMPLRDWLAGAVAQALAMTGAQA